jgi:hypothetical protein
MPVVVFAISTVEAIVGWALLGIGILAILLALAAAALEAFRKAVQKSARIQSLASSTESPWSKVIDAIVDVAKELMGKTGGVPFFMGLFLTVLGILILNDVF